MNLLSLRIDLHVHTCYSEDAASSLEEIIFYAKKRRLNGIAITDHDSVEGTRRAMKLADKRGVMVIPGIEVTTLHGHVLGLNITTRVPQNLSLVETVEKIHEADGIAIAAHPLVFIKSHMKQQIASASNLDGIEVINSAAFPFLLSTRLSRALAERLNLPQTAGSDAHHASEIGTAYTLVKADSEVDEVVDSIRQGTVIPCGKAISWETRIRRGAFSLKKWL